MTSPMRLAGNSPLLRAVNRGVALAPIGIPASGPPLPVRPWQRAQWRSNSCYHWTEPQAGRLSEGAGRKAVRQPKCRTKNGRGIALPLYLTQNAYRDDNDLVMLPYVGSAGLYRKARRLPASWKETMAQRAAHILIVDDEAEVRRLLGSGFRRRAIPSRRSVAAPKPLSILTEAGGPHHARRASRWGGWVQPRA